MHFNCTPVVTGFALLLLASSAAAQSTDAAPTQALRFSVSGLAVRVPRVDGEFWKVGAPSTASGVPLDTVVHIGHDGDVDTVATVALVREHGCEELMSPTATPEMRRTPIAPGGRFYPVMLTDDALHAHMFCADTGRGALMLDAAHPSMPTLSEAASHHLGVLDGTLLAALYVAALPADSDDADRR